MTSNSKNSAFFGEALLLAFIVLKLCHVIAWSWWWVLSPVWIGFVIALAIGIPVVACAIAKRKKYD